MNKKTLWILIAIVAVVGLIVLNILLNKNKGTPVDVVKLDSRELKSIVSASGKIQPKISVDISATTPGKVTKVAVEEGDYVEKGQFLLQIDPTTAVSQVEQTRASISAAAANHELSIANLEQAQIDLDRVEKLFDKKLASPNEVQKSRTEVHVRKASVNAAKEEIARLKAALATAEHQLSQVNIHSDITGIVTKRNIEEGENVFVGAFNNPATVLLTIADLTIIEALVEVDETDIIDVKVGHPADIKVDAYPDSSFAGFVTEVGHSPILGTSGQQQATSFEVIIQLDEDIPHVRSGLSCKADIRTGYREDALAVPIQALTLRDDASLKPKKKKYGAKKAAADSLKNEENKEPYQGVFVVNDDKVTFQAVETGIAGDRYFEVLSGLEKEDMVVTGPFSALRKLTNEEPVKTTVKEIE
ncbi:MAG: efflux RND transporter periplasmic adaptor subunit [Calditrichaeota bacterium]|nr:MAG: efflux RND transporter periplasmic adaptor subunit [Calditrichota bacterium]